VGRARCAEAADYPRRATTAGRDDEHTWIVKKLARVSKTDVVSFSQSLPICLNCFILAQTVGFMGTPHRRP